MNQIIRTDKYEVLTNFTMGIGYDDKGQAAVCLTLNGKLYVMSPQAAKDIEAAFKEYNQVVSIPKKIL